MILAYLARCKASHSPFTCGLHCFLHPASSMQRAARPTSSSIIGRGASERGNGVWNTGFLSAEGQLSLLNALSTWPPLSAVSTLSSFQRRHAVLVRKIDALLGCCVPEDPPRKGRRSVPELKSWGLILQHATRPSLDSFPPPYGKWLASAPPIWTSRFTENPPLHGSPSRLDLSAT